MSRATISTGVSSVHAAASGDRLTEARSWNARSLALVILDRWDEAISAAQNAIQGYAVAGVKEATAGAYGVQGVGLIALGRPGEALAAFEAARDYASAAETAERANLSLTIAGAAEAAAARALAEAATALAAADPQAAAQGLRRSADALGIDAQFVRPAWLVAEAQRLGS